jgi:hypothetical protein
VLIVDLNDAEAEKVLATFDPLAAMAEPHEGSSKRCSRGSRQMARRWRRCSSARAQVVLSADAFVAISKTVSSYTIP